MKMSGHDNFLHHEEKPNSQNGNGHNGNGYNGNGHNGNGYHTKSKPLKIEPLVIDSIPGQKEPSLVFLHSVYMHPYFTLPQNSESNSKPSKSAQFVKELCDAIEPKELWQEDIDHPADVTPFYLAKFSECSISFTDGLHRFNDLSVIRFLNENLFDYISQKLELQNPTVDLDLKAALSMLDNDDFIPNEKMNSSAKRANQYIGDCWSEYFEKIFLERENEEFARAIGLHCEFDEIDPTLSAAIKKYQAYARNWDEILRSAFSQKENLNTMVSTCYWQDFRKIDKFYWVALELFKEWWKKGSFKTTVKEYCKNFVVKCYSDKLERIFDKDSKEKIYPKHLTYLSSAFFVCEELVGFLAKVLRDGPLILVYPTANLGATTETKIKASPFCELKTLIEQLAVDLTFLHKMKVEGMPINPENLYLEFSHPKKTTSTLQQAQVPVATTSTDNNALASSPTSKDETPEKELVQLKTMVRALETELKELKQTNTKTTELMQSNFSELFKKLSQIEKNSSSRSSSRHNSSSNNSSEHNSAEEVDVNGSAPPLNHNSTEEIGVNGSASPLNHNSAEEADVNESAPPVNHNICSFKYSRAQVEENSTSSLSKDSSNYGNNCEEIEEVGSRHLQPNC